MSFLECWLARTAEQPERAAFVFRSHEAGDVALSYATLHAEASSIAHWIAALSPPDAAIALCLHERRDFVVTFLGCLLARRVPVVINADLAPFSPPYVAQICAEARPAVVVGDRRSLDAVREHAAGGRLVDVASAPRGATYAPLLDVDPDAVAFIQYSSGTTGKPKGVAIRQRNLVANMRVIAAGFRATTSQRVVNWLPFHHDMGLVGNLLQIVWAGGTCVQLDPADFIKKPARWLQAISDFRATTSGGPDFGYRLALRKTSDEELAALDLSSWEVAYNGAEPVLKKTIDAFTERFARCGFRSSAFYPCYGFAETTLMLTGAHVERDPIATMAPSSPGATSSRELDLETLPDAPIVACGRPFAGHGVVIADASGNELPDRVVGEVLAWGESVVDRYLSPADGEDRFVEVEGRRCYRTGDLGFVDGGELYLVGRSDDVMILKGRNLLPYEIESRIDTMLGAAERGKSVVFPDRDQERLVVVLELNESVLAAWGVDDESERKGRIKRGAVRAFGVSVADVRFVARGTIPITTSGKIKRATLRRMYLDGAPALGERIPAEAPC